MKHFISICVLIVLSLCAAAQERINCQLVSFLPVGMPNDIIRSNDEVYMAADGGVWRYNLQTASFENINAGINGEDGADGIGVTDLFNWNGMLHALKNNGKVYELGAEGWQLKFMGEERFAYVAAVGSEFYGYKRVFPGESGGAKLVLVHFNETTESFETLGLPIADGFSEVRPLANIADDFLMLTNGLGVYRLDGNQITALPNLPNVVGVFGLDAANLYAWRDTRSQEMKSNLLKLDNSVWVEERIDNGQFITEDITDVFATDYGVGINFLAEADTNQFVPETYLLELPDQGSSGLPFNPQYTSFDYNTPNPVGIADNGAVTLVPGSDDIEVRLNRFVNTNNTTLFAQGYASSKHITAGIRRDKFYTVFTSSTNDAIGILQRYNVNGNQKEFVDNRVLLVDYSNAEPVYMRHRGGSGYSLFQLNGFGEFERIADISSAMAAPSYFELEDAFSMYQPMGQEVSPVTLVYQGGRLETLSNMPTELGNVEHAVYDAETQQIFMSGKRPSGSFNRHVYAYHVPTATWTRQILVNEEENSKFLVSGLSILNDSLIIRAQKFGEDALFDGFYGRSTEGTEAFALITETEAEIPRSFQPFYGDFIGFEDQQAMVHSGDVSNWTPAVFDGIPEGATITDFTAGENGQFIIATAANGVFTTEGLLSGIGTEAEPMETLSVYPNPAQSVVYLDTDNPAWLGATVYNIAGQAVAKVTRVSGQLAIDVEHLAPGMYTGKLHGDAGTAFIRFVKQ